MNIEFDSYILNYRNLNQFLETDNRIIIPIKISRMKGVFRECVVYFILIFIL